MFYDPYSHYSSEYERQQLNILRAARGITPPIPPPRRYVGFMENWFWMTIIGGASVLAFVGSGLALLSGDGQTGLWRAILVLLAPLVTFVVGWNWRWAMLDAEYEETLRRWRDAGCP